MTIAELRNRLEEAVFPCTDEQAARHRADAMQLVRHPAASHDREIQLAVGTGGISERSQDACTASGTVMIVGLSSSRSGSVAK